MSELALPLPDELVDAIAERVALKLEERRPTTNADSPASPWLNVEEAAAYLRCERARIYNLVSQRRLPCSKDGTRTLLHREVLDAYLTGGDPWAVAPGSSSAGRNDLRSRTRR